MGERSGAVLFGDKGKMGGIGKASNLDFALNPFYQFDKIFFYSSPVRSKEANWETI